MQIDSDILINQIIKNSFDLIFWKDRDLKFLGCNLAFAKMANFEEPKQLIGKTDKDMCWEKYSVKYQADDNRVLLGEVIETIENNTTFEEITRIVYIRKQPIRNIDHSIIGLVGYGKVLSEHTEGVTNPILNPLSSNPLDKIIINTKLISEHYFNLSSAEIESLYFIVRGYSASQTAKVLNKSKRTIEQHIDNAKIKMSVDSKQLLINKAISLGFVSIIPDTVYKFLYHQKL